MLSIGAFNALLKTLEEPPSYVIFILATTEVHKIPITILSRCQRYDFKRIALETIADRLRELTQAENIQVEDRALLYVACLLYTSYIQLRRRLTVSGHAAAQRDSASSFWRP